MLRFFDTLLSVNVHIKSELIDVLKKMKSELEKITDSPKETAALEYYFAYLSWIESKIENRPFADIMKEKAVEIKYD